MFKLNETSAIKLFGKTIPLLTLNQEEEALTNHELSVKRAAREDSCDGNLRSSSDSLGGVKCNDEYQAQAPKEDQESIGKEFPKDKQEDGEPHQIKEDLKDPTTLSGNSDNGRSPFKSSKNEEISCETNSSQEKSALKKPDKKLPCPRCNSMETKFCYYNNYNVNQPRHFCNNCQRYWTAGGTMRNVPVGAGRRKTRSSSALHFHHGMISEAIRAAQASAANGIQQNPSCENNNSRVLTFGSDSSSVFNVSGKRQIDAQNGFHRPEQAEGKNHQWFPSKTPCFTRPLWPDPWDSIQRSTATLPPPPTFCPPSFPLSFHPAVTYRNYGLPSPWDVPLASLSPSSVNLCAPSSSPSPSLGKHSRDENILSPANLEPSGESNKSERRASDSETLRIDDSGETAKSSMLATLLVKSKKTNSINSGGLFDGFQAKSSDDRNYRLETFSVLRANPAALSRSLNFQQNT